MGVASFARWVRKPGHCIFEQAYRYKTLAVVHDQSNRELNEMINPRD